MHLMSLNHGIGEFRLPSRGECLHSGAQVMDLFEELNREGVTVLIITHDNGIASRARNKVEIRDGELGHLEENGKGRN